MGRGSRPLRSLVRDDSDLVGGHTSILPQQAPGLAKQAPSTSNRAQRMRAIWLHPQACMRMKQARKWEKFKSFA